MTKPLTADDVLSKCDGDVVFVEFRDSAAQSMCGYGAKIETRVCVPYMPVDIDGILYRIRALRYWDSRPTDAESAARSWA